MRFVTEKHQELVKALDELVKALVSENLNNKKSLAQTTLQKANELKSSVSTQDCPNWLPSLIQGLNYFIEGGWNQSNLIDHLIKNMASIKGHIWIFENQTETAFNFDSIFEHYKSESKLPELFDEIIRILEEIETSGEIDSIAMITALGKVISTIKKNKDGSYFSLNSAWAFLIAFLKNYMWTELSKIPVLGSALEALEKTINEANEEMFKVHNQVQKEMARTVEAEVKGLKDKTSFKFIGYDKTGATINDNMNSLSLSEKV
jgi:hypothetical protein